MQKKVIALAVAGLISAPVFAQSNVTVYGVADVTFENVRARDAATSGADNATRLHRNRLQSNSSLLGFKGVEDLGNGLKALFQFETGINADGGGALGAGSGLIGGQRDTFVALQSGFGTVIAGIITHPVRAMGSKVDLNPGATGIGFMGAVYETLQTPAGVGGALRTGTGDRQQLVAYVSPSFAGLTGTLAYLPGEARTPSTATGPELQPRAWQAAVQYENGPLYAGLGYHRADDATVITNAGPNGLGLSGQENKFTDWRVAAKYTLGTGTTLSGMWDRQKAEVDAFGALAGGEVRRNAWTVNVGQSFGPHTVHVGYARSNDASGSLCAANACDDTSTRMWSLGYEYALSKRTMLKAIYADIRNDSNANVDFYTAAVSNNGTVGVVSGLARGADPRGFGLGVRHSF